MYSGIDRLSDRPCLRTDLDLSVSLVRAMASVRSQTECSGFFFFCSVHVDAFQPLMSLAYLRCWCFLFTTNTLCHLVFNLLFPCIYILSQWISVSLPYLLAVSINWLTSIGYFQWMGGSWALTWSKRERCFASSAVMRRSCRWKKKKKKKPYSSHLSHLLV